MSQETLLEKLKLVKSVTENYTCKDENNKIVVFENVRDLINAYINVKLKFLGFRKDNSVSEMIDNLDVLKYKAYFISSVIKGEILVNNKSKQEIITQIEQNEKIKKVEDSYDYLLRMPIYSLTKEKVQEIKEQITDTKNEIDTLKNTPLEEIWKGDL
jgi:DNA topoisomerase-2